MCSPPFAPLSAPHESTQTTLSSSPMALQGVDGSLTALPVTETQAGECFAFVPTNVILRTARSSWRRIYQCGCASGDECRYFGVAVGGAAQTKIVKKL